MKKVFAVILAMTLALGCAAALAEGEATEHKAAFTIYNGTGELVKELVLFANEDESKTDLITVPEDKKDESVGGLAPNNYVYWESNFVVPEDKLHGYFTLKFKTESGYEGVFDSLSIEEAPITLLSEADAASAATPQAITFKKLEWPSAYTIYNVTGEPVVELSFTDNVTGSVLNLLEEGATLAAGDSVEATYPLPIEEDASHRLTLKFKTESGYEGTFDHLSVEMAPISLLSEADAASSATPQAIAFRPYIAE